MTMPGPLRYCAFRTRARPGVNSAERAPGQRLAAPEASRFVNASATIEVVRIWRG